MPLGGPGDWAALGTGTLSLWLHFLGWTSGASGFTAPCPRHCRELEPRLPVGSWVSDSELLSGGQGGAKRLHVRITPDPVRSAPGAGAATREATRVAGSPEKHSFIGRSHFPPPPESHSE